jgi:hypothetical protein
MNFFRFSLLLLSLGNYFNIFCKSDLPDCCINKEKTFLHITVHPSTAYDKEVWQDILRMAHAIIDKAEEGAPHEIIVNELHKFLLAAAYAKQNGIKFCWGIVIDDNEKSSD